MTYANGWIVGAIGFALLSSPTAEGAPVLGRPTSQAHALARLGFGPRPGDLERVGRIGVARYLDEQFAPDRGEPEPLRTRLASLTTAGQTPESLYKRYEEVRNRTPGGGRREALHAARRVLEETTSARLARAVESPHQLHEALASVWFDHFNVFSGKEPLQLWVGVYERDAIRPHVLGRFRDMLYATARHPAMLLYLDNWRNTAASKGRRGGLNENYARELLELHTLGVDGGYTQADVVALAHLLTGWGFVPPKGKGRATFEFQFDASRHDGAAQVLLGHVIAAGGVEQGEHALDLLAAHPATARHVALRLARAFVADDPPSELVAAMAERFGTSGGDLAAVMRTLVASQAFWDAPPRFKTPLRYYVSALRAGDRRNYAWAVRGLNQSGAPLYGCPSPNGYSPLTKAWLDPAALRHRIGLAVQLAKGEPKKDPAAEPPLQAAVLESAWVLPLSPTSQQALDAASPTMRAAALLGSPEFMQE